MWRENPPSLKIFFIIINNSHWQHVAGCCSSSSGQGVDEISMVFRQRSLVCEDDEWELTHTCPVDEFLVCPWATVKMKWRWRAAHLVQLVSLEEETHLPPVLVAHPASLMFQCWCFPQQNELRNPSWSQPHHGDQRPRPKAASTYKNQQWNWQWPTHTP